MRLYQKLDLDAALAELQLAEADAKDSQDETVQVLIYRGLIYSETGKLSEASDQFKRALAIRPWAEVPPDTSPRIAKNFSDARKSLWGMASVKPPQKRAAAAPKAVPASATAPAADVQAVPDKK
jgi:tetratricopeptide (TPR) repeat protein